MPRVSTTATIAAATAFALAVHSGAAVAATVAREGYVQSAACAACHSAEYERWSGSHHQLAMQEASPATVRGDFGDRKVTIGRVSAHFRRKGDEFWIGTSNPDGTATDYRVRYTFGVEPLQQYLVELPGGRMQAFTLAWDTRPQTSGGQRWFHVVPEEAGAPAGDPLHWSGLYFNWNSQCAACHSTSVDKGYDGAADTYRTTWAEISVGCEACHGPGGAHVAWAEKRDSGGVAAPPANGLRVDFATTGRELDVCSPCHSRRTEIAPLLDHGAAYFDHFIPENLQQGIYHSDGQILEEVFEFGSFAQSRMHAGGVRCSDCHDPHSARLRASGDALCVTCHNANGNERFPSLQKADYVSPSHHHHAPEKDGARCVSCHMPARTYMAIDERHDHGFRVPRPHLTPLTDAPNACNQCHTDRTPQWASEAIRAWTGRGPAPHWSQLMAAGRRGDSDALLQLANNPALSAIVRATALDLLAQRGAAPDGLVARAAADRDPLLRIAAARALQSMSGRERNAVAASLLTDPLRAVRIEAAGAFADASPSLTGDAAARFASAATDYRAAQKANADRPEALHNLAGYFARTGDLAEAKRLYARAIDRGPYFVPAYVNLADVHRLEGDDAAAVAVLRRALTAEPNSAAAHHALGLALVRQGDTAAAVAELAAAASAAPDEARYAYVYGVALHSVGQLDEAIRQLAAASERHPTDSNILAALLAIHRERGNAAEVQRISRTLAELRMRAGHGTP